MRTDFYELLRQAPAPICVLVGEDLVFEMANDLYLQVAGRKDVVGKRLLDVIPEARGQGYDDLLRNVMRTGVPYAARESLVRIDRGNGIEDAYFTFTFSPLRNEHGKVDRVMALVTEVTDQVRARQLVDDARRRAEDLSRRLQLALAASGLGTWDYDPKSNRAEWSERTYEIQGIPPGTPVTLESSLAHVHPDHRASVAATVQRALSGSERSLALDYRVVHGDGTIRWVRSRGMAVLENGEITRLTGTVADVTAEKLAAQEAQLRSIITMNATLPLFMMDERQHCTFMNQAAVAMTGFTVDEVQGRPLHEFIHHTHPDGRPYPIEECPIDRALPTRSREQGEDVFVRKDGTFYPVAFTASPIVVGERAIGTVIEVRELTKEKAALAERERLLERERIARRDAEAANRAKDEFLAMLGHELRNPLAPMVSGLQIIRLRNGGTLPPEMVVIERQVSHLRRLVDDLLDVSRIMSGKVELRRKRVTLADVFGNAIEISSPLLEQKSHHLSVRCPPELAVDGDEVRLAQVVANLLSNAAKYTEPGGHLSLTAETTGANVSIKVRDDGVGIPPELLPRVFDLFVQGHRTIDRSQGGLGLGLTIVKSLVLLHGGTVRARSEGVGRGSEFVIELPAARGPAATQEVTRPAIAAKVRPLRILVVDDNHDAAEMLGETLAVGGHDVSVAFDAPSALERAADRQFDVALLDIGLPVMDGYELARRLKEAQPHVRLIAVTGYGQPSDRERAFESGFAEHLVKPLEIPVLESVLERISR